MPVDRQPGDGRPVTLHVSAHGCAADSLLAEPRATVLSVWSAPLTANSADGDGLVERRLDIGRGQPLRVWEETRDSIARHIWYYEGGLRCSLSPPH